MSAVYTTKRHMNLMSVIVFVLCLLLVSGNTVFAYPYMQLDAYPSGYSGGSIVTTGPVFTLYALVNSDAPEWSASDLTDTDRFYISVAIIPDPGNTSPDLGSYEFGGETFNVTGAGVTAGGDVYDAMTYGVPPLDAHLKAKSLPSHGVFDTYYREHEFTLVPTGQADLYNSQDNPGGPVADVPGGALYYQAFDVDATGLDYPFVLHFDFYAKVDGSIVDFAPFSHDVTHTPVPGAVLLGILGLGVAGVKLRKFA